MRSVILAALLFSFTEIGFGEVVYLLKIESIGYEAEKHPPARDSVFSSIEVAVQPDQKFHVEFATEDWSALAKGRLSKTEHKAFLLQITYERKSPSGKQVSQTSVHLTPGEPHILGAVYHTLEGKEQLFSKDAVRVTLQQREENNTGDARSVRTQQRSVRIVPALSPDPMHIERGMIFDALQHEQRIKKLLRDKRNLPTTINGFDPELTPPGGALPFDRSRR